MANEIQHHLGSGGQTPTYALIYNITGQVYFTGSPQFVTYTSSQFFGSGYHIFMTGQVPTSRYFVGNFPAIPADIYNVSIYSRTGVGLSEGDRFLDFRQFQWNGTGVMPLNNLGVNLLQISGVRVGLQDVQNISSGDYAYYAEVKFIQDTSNDEYTVQWYRNSSPLASGAFTSPTIQVIKRVDGTDLIASTSLDHISTSIGTLKKNEGTNRIADGEDHIVKVQATVDGAIRTWQKLVGRDV